MEGEISIDILCPGANQIEILTPVSKTNSITAFAQRKQKLGKAGTPPKHRSLTSKEFVR